MKRVGLVGFGVSNQALCTHFLGLGYEVYVHLPDKRVLPSNVHGVFGEDYLSCPEELVFRSPAIRPDRIRAHSKIMCESDYSLSLLKMPKICVSGSDGKTTTCSLIYEVLSMEHHAFLGGNIGNVLFNAFNKDYEFAVCELSSFQLFDFAPECEIGVLTGITENHLDWHKSMSEYALCKENVLKNARHRVLCYDNPYTREIAKKYSDATLYSLSDLSHLGKSHVYLKGDYIYRGSEKIISKNEILLRGDFNLLNIMACIATTYPYVKKESLVRAISSFKGVAHRLEPVKAIRGVSFFDSSIDTTPSRTLATLSAFDNSKVVVILGGSDKNLSYEAFAHSLCSLRGAIVLGENKGKLLPNLKCKHVRAVNTLYEAVLSAFDIAREGDSIILSPASASFDMFSSYKERGAEFCKIVNNLS